MEWLAEIKIDLLEPLLVGRLDAILEPAFDVPSDDHHVLNGLSKFAAKRKVKLPKAVRSGCTCAGSFSLLVACESFSDSQKVVKVALRALSTG